MALSYLAPIYDYTDLPFRLLCQKYGAGATCVPLVSAAAIANDAEKISLVDAHSDEKNIGVQLVGFNPAWMEIAAVRIMNAFEFISWLNINCGCPSARTMGYGGGSALLSSPERIMKLVRAIKKKVDVPLSVKIRIDDDAKKTLALCKKIEEAGADMLIVHGRTVKQGYSGKADWETIKAIKDEIEIPVVGNGDIMSMEQGKELVRKGYCDSFMIGRAAMNNPMVFSGKKFVNAKERFSMLEEYIRLSDKYGCDTIKRARIKAINMLSGIRDAKKIRDKVVHAESVEDILGIKSQL